MHIIERCNTYQLTRKISCAILFSGALYSATMGPATSFDRGAGAEGKIEASRSKTSVPSVRSPAKSCGVLQATPGTQIRNRPTPSCPGSYKASRPVLRLGEAFSALTADTKPLESSLKVFCGI